MAAIRVLVIDPDPRTVAVVSAALSRKGYEITSVGDAESGYDAARRGKPHLVIVESLPKVLDGPGLVRDLRTGPEHSLIPTVFLGDKAAVEERIREFRIAADCFLSKPFSAADLESRVIQALQAHERMETTMMRPKAGQDEDWTVAMKAFRGSLDQVGLASLLSLFEIDRKSGVLVLLFEDPPAEKVRIHFLDGRVLRARLDGKETPRNADLVYRILGRTRGKFDFRPSGVEEEDEIGTTTTALILEGMRQLDERRGGG